MIATTPHPVVLRSNELTIRTATESFEISQLRAVLDEQHYLKAGRPAGHVLWQGAYEHDPESGMDRLVAVFCWAGAAKRLKDRDAWIGWDAVTCANRLKLVVQLRRFVIIDEHRRSNLASQCLGLALRELPTEWQRVHGFRPLLAESFHDPARHQGTLYKVTNWTPLGLTKGFRRHRADFYQDLESPKQLWIRPLQKNARSLLALPGPLPGEHQKGVAEATCGARCALPNHTLRSLRDALRQVADPRSSKSRRHPISAMLTLICYGLLCGAADVKAIWKKCGPLNQQQRAAIGLTKRCKNSGLLIMPGYDAFNDLVNAVDPASLAAALNQWLLSNSDLLPKTLAMDGKDLGGKGTLGAIITLCHHVTGAPLAMATYSGAKDDCERPADWTSDIESKHGRIEWRELRVASFDLDLALFPGARQLVSLTRFYCDKKSAGDFKSETRHFITSLTEEKASHARLAEIARGHWSVENKNHWKKDATLWREDRGVRRKAKGAKTGE